MLVWTQVVYMVAAVKCMQNTENELLKLSRKCPELFIFFNSLHKIFFMYFYAQSTKLGILGVQNLILKDHNSIKVRQIVEKIFSWHFVFLHHNYTISVLFLLFFFSLSQFPSFLFLSLFHILPSFLLIYFILFLAYLPVGLFHQNVIPNGRRGHWNQTFQKKNLLHARQEWSPWKQGSCLPYLVL